MICSKCTTFDQLFLRRVIKIDATRCPDFSSKCTKMCLAAGRHPDPLGELAHSAPIDPLAGSNGFLLLREMEGEMRSILYPDLGIEAHADSSNLIRFSQKKNSVTPIVLHTKMDVQCDKLTVVAVELS